MDDESEHRMHLKDGDRGRSFYVECVCGWRSTRTTTAGLAGAAFDKHVNETAL